MADAPSRTVYDLSWKRTKHESCTLEESFFAFTDVSALPQYDRVRHLVNRWVADIPDKAWPHWLQRYTSDHTMHHFGALYELLLFEVFRVFGFEVEWEPQTNGPSIPDFRIAAEPAILVEAAAFAADADHNNAMDAAYRLLDRTSLSLPATAHRVEVRIRTRPKSRPNEESFRSWAKASFLTMKPRDELTYVCPQSGLELLLTAKASSREAGKRIHCSLGEGEAHYDQTGESFRTVINRKIKQHSIGKRIETQFLLTLGVVDDQGGNFGHDEVLDELYGRRYIRLGGPSMEVVGTGRHPNGVLWRSGATKEPRTYPAAFLIANGWRDLDPARCRFTLFDNAYASAPILQNWPFRRIRASAESGLLETVEGDQEGLACLARLLAV